MKDRLYLVIFGAIVLAILGDVALNNGRATVFLVQKIMALQEYLQFWRR